MTTVNQRGIPAARVLRILASVESTIQRIDDWRRERRIVRLRERCLRLYRAGRHDLALSAWEELRDECLARSPQQVARMECRLGLQGSR